MSTLDDKLLGEKLHYYCSDSEDEDKNKCVETRTQQPNHNRRLKASYATDRYSTNTGPKGVIKDWQRYKQLEVERKENEDRERLQLMQKLSLSCRSNSEEQSAEKTAAQTDEDIDKLLSDPSDPFLKQYMVNRMEEMMENIETDRKHRPVFGKLIYLKSGADFLNAIDKEKKSVTIICHIYSDNIKGCDAMNSALQCLAEKYVNIKFCSLEAATAGMSKHFEKCGVPALLIYKDCNLLGNFVRLTDEFDDQFSPLDVEKFLVEHGFLPDHSLVPKLIMTRSSIRESAINDDDDDDSE